MEYLLVGSLALGLFFGALLLGKRNRTKADGLLALWFGLMSLHVAAVLGVERQQLTAFRLVLHLSQALTLLTGVILWLYAQALTRPGFQLRRYGQHLLPALVALVLMTWALAGPESANRGQWFRAITTWAGLVSVLGYCLGILRTVRQHRQVAEQFFSDAEQVRLYWLRNTARCSLLLLAVMGVSQLVFTFSPVQISQFGNWYANLLLCGTLIVVGYFGVQQHALYAPGARTAHEAQLVLDQLPAAPPDLPLALDAPTSAPAGPAEGSRKYQRSGLALAGATALWEKLQVHMLQQRPYLDPALSLALLSQQLAVTPHHLSQVINEQGRANFFDFVNGYRVAAVREQLHAQEHARLTLLGVALNCGFNSKASFNRAFKKFTQLTPQAYVQQQGAA